MILEVIRLTNVEMRLAKFIARGRMQTVAKDRRVGDPRKAERDEFVGSAGEIAFAKWMNVYPNMSIDLQPGSPDYVIAGVTIDVKTTELIDGDLVVPISKKLGQSMLFVLVTMNAPVFRVVGFLDEKNVIHDRNIGDRGWGRSYWVARSNLMNIQELRSWIKFESMGRGQRHI